MLNLSTTQLDFSVSNQSMWQAGPSGGMIGFNCDTLLWSKSGANTYPYNSSFADISFGYSYSITAGPTFEANLSAGSVAIDYPIQVDLAAPDAVKSGDRFAIYTAGWRVSNAVLSSIGPTIEARAGILLDVAASFSPISIDAAGFDPITFSIPDFNGSFSPKFDLTSGSHDFGHYLTLDWNLAQSINGISAPMGTVTNALPVVHATARQGTDMIALSADIDALVTTAAQLPPLETYYYLDLPTARFVSYNPSTFLAHPTSARTVDLDVNDDGKVDNDFLVFGYSLVDVGATVGVKLAQDFTFLPSSVTVTMRSSTGEVHTGPLGQQFQFSAPASGSGDLTITSNYTLSGTLRTKTGVILHGSVDGSALALDVSAEPAFSDLFEGSLISGHLSVDSTPRYLEQRDIPITLQAAGATQIIHYEATAASTPPPANLPPSGVSLSNWSVSENQPGATVGRVEVTDPDGNNAHTLAVDDPNFIIDSNRYLKLAPNVSLDYETQPSATLTVTATDAAGASISRPFTVNVQDVLESAPGPHAPTRIELNDASVPENAAGVRIGFLHTIDQDSFEHFSYQVSDPRFVVGSVQDLRLKPTESLNYETEPSVDIVVTVTDKDGLSHDQAFSIQVEDVLESTSSAGATVPTYSEPPFVVSLSAETIMEDIPGAYAGVVRINGRPIDSAYSISVDHPDFEIDELGWLKLRDDRTVDYERVHGVPVYLTVANMAGESVTWHFVLEVQDFVDQVTLDGGFGDDVLVVGPGTDFASGYDGNDTFMVGGGNSNIDGGAGDDLAVVDLSASSGTMPARYTVTDLLGNSCPFQDYVYFNEADTWFGAGMAGIGGFHMVKGNTGSTTFVGIERFDILGTPQDDFIPYLGGNQYHGGAGMDTLYANWSAASSAISWTNTGVSATPVEGVTVSGMERLLLRTGSGNDVIDNTAFATDDYLDTGDGDDSLRLGGGHDILRGGGGADTYRITLDAGYNYREIYDDGGTIVFDGVANLAAVTLGRSGDALELRVKGTDNLMSVRGFFADSSTRTNYDAGWSFQFDGQAASAADVVGTLYANHGIESVELRPIPGHYFGSGIVGVYEGAAGARIGEVDISDWDAGDTHTLTVDDPRVVVTQTSHSVYYTHFDLRLAPDVALDFETSPNLWLTMTATDSGGATLTSTVRVDVLDVEETTPTWDINRLGGEFQMNSFATGLQSQPKLCALADGGFVAIWDSVGQDGDVDGIYGQRYAANGARIGGEFRVNTYTTERQEKADIVALAEGGFVVTWNSWGQSGAAVGIFGQRYDSAANRVAGEFRVGASADISQYNSSVAAMAGGGFVVARKNGYVPYMYGDIYAADGSLTLANVQLNETPNNGYKPAVAGLAAGGFAAVWSDVSDIYVRLFAANGTTTASATRVNTFTTGSQGDPELATLADGSLVVVWRSEGQDGSQGGIYGQRMAADGTKLGGEFLVNPITYDNQTAPSVASLPNGGFVVTWTSQGGLDGDGDGVFGRAFDAAGQPVGGHFQLGQGLGSQDLSAVTALNDGTLVTAWRGSSATEGEIFGQRFTIDTTEKNQAPTAIALDNRSVPEDVEAAVVGWLSTTDPNAGDSHSYTVSDGRFEVVGSQVQLVAGQRLDYAAADTISLTVTATDPGGLLVQQRFTLAVAPAGLVGNALSYSPAVGHYHGITAPSTGIDHFTADWSSATTAIIWANAPAAAVSQAVNGVRISGVERLELQTGAGNDVLANPDVATDDSFATGAGNDRITGGGGNDLIDGGAGFDTAVFSGAAASHSITRGASSTIVSGADGTDTLIGIERLQFDDRAVLLQVAASDFDGDGKSDVLWRNTVTGADVAWKSANSATTLAVKTLADQNWLVAGTGDFDGDGKSDILWRNLSTGGNNIWKSAESTTAQATAAFTDLNWKVAGIGDFNGDGKSDILWRNGATATNKIWLSANSATVQTVAKTANLDWQVAGIGDFDGDGKSDILWRNGATGGNLVWKGASSTATLRLATQNDLAWKVAGVGDFNGDGKSDILWRNGATGANKIWLAGSGANVQTVTTAGVAWQVVGTGDYDGDGRSDILWRNTTTTACNIWKGGSSTASQSVTTRPLDNAVIDGVNSGDLLFGGTGNNRLIGTLDSDSMNGGAGSDTLYGGGGGKDVMVGGAGNDTFVVDRVAALTAAISDFVAGQDKLGLGQSAYGGLFSAGVLNTGVFATGSSDTFATTAQRLQYNAASGALWYDSDGTGAAAAVQIATLGSVGARPSVAASDFMLLAG